jgi:hypothetical protein
MITATAVYEAHHRGFRVTLRGATGHQIAHEVGMSDRDVVALARTWRAQVTVLPAQA